MIRPRLMHEFFVRAGLHDLPVREYQHPVGPAQQAQSARHDKRRATGHRLAQCGHNFILRARIHRGGGIV